MAEQVQRFRQYEYRANSNLVLTTETHRPRNEIPHKVSSSTTPRPRIQGRELGPSQGPALVESTAGYTHRAG